MGTKSWLISKSSCFYNFILITFRNGGIMSITFRHILQKLMEEWNNSVPVFVESDIELPYYFFHLTIIYVLPTTLCESLKHISSYASFRPWEESQRLVWRPCDW